MLKTIAIGSFLDRDITSYRSNIIDWIRSNEGGAEFFSMNISSFQSMN